MIVDSHHQILSTVYEKKNKVQDIHEHYSIDYCVKPNKQRKESKRVMTYTSLVPIYMLLLCFMDWEFDASFEYIFILRYDYDYY